ncbi:MAG: copper transporter, partial [Actinomycetota bacterium]
MISFRYHVVTIVAVFLALIIGVLLGTTVVKQSVIDDLRRRADTALNATDRLRADVNDLN